MKLARWTKLSIERIRHEYNVGVFVSNLRRAPSHSTVSVMKTVVNAWTTTHRLHLERRSSCVFGCVHDNRFEHYLQCFPLMTAVSTSLSDPPPIPPPTPSCFFPGPLDSKKDILRIFVAYHTYHSVRHSDCASSVHGQRYCNTVRAAIAARHLASSLGYDIADGSPETPTTGVPRLGRAAGLLRPHFVTEVAAISTAATISNTRFVPGGDHFITTSFSSIAPAESSPSAREELLAGCIEP